MDIWEHARHRSRTVMAMIAVLALVLAACGGTDSSGRFEATDASLSTDAGGFGIDESMIESEAPVAAQSDAAQGEVAQGDGASADAESPEAAPAEPATEEGLGRGGVEPVALTPADIGRDIIFTAQITTAVTDVIAAGEEATRIIQGLGGLVFGQRTTGSPEPTSVLTFKVFPADFQTALDRLGSIGELRDQSVSADDVTERVVDLKSRITTSEASVERLRGFLANATDTATIAELERQLLERETNLETLRGQLRTVSDQVALATIVLNIVQANSRPAITLSLTGYAGHDNAGGGCPGQGPLQVDEGGDVTVCVEITNAGDTTLTELALTDPILGIDIDDLVTVFGDPRAELEPGQAVLLAAEIVAERDIRSRTTVTAVALDADGNPIPTRNATATGSLFIDTVTPEGIPGFTDGLEESFNLLISLVRYLILLAGVLLPFVWIIPLVWWLRRRNEQKVTPIVRQRISEVTTTNNEESADPEPEVEPEPATS